MGMHFAGGVAAGYGIKMFRRGFGHKRACAILLLQYHHGAAAHERDTHGHARIASG